MTRKLLVIQVAALGWDFLRSRHDGGRWHGLQFEPMDPVFPAVTCPAQASFRTARPPHAHGMRSNAAWIHPLRRPLFWEQSSELVAGPRIWDELRSAGGTVGMMFWQQSLGEAVDMVLSPAPVHKHGGGLIDDVYSRPAGLYHDLCRRLHARFRLGSYWGPLARLASTRWIARATASVMRYGPAPDLLLTYLPHLDYALQKHGPEGMRADRALRGLLGELARLLDAAQAAGYETVVYGDYAMQPAERVIYPNRALRRARLMAVRGVKGRLYADLHTSRAFAVVDHQVAHVYGPGRAEAARCLEARCPGVQTEPCEGCVQVTAPPGAWFAYPWWTDREQAPDYAGHIDIHRKPGFDPCELFVQLWPPGIGRDPRRVGGTHGRADRPVAVASTLERLAGASDLLGLASAVRNLWRPHP
jgi:hypothetical protein